MNKFPDKRSSSESEPNLDSVGIMLKKARISARIEADELCGKVRISREHLEALETGRYEKLPGDPYIRAFLVTLCKHLHLNSKEVLDKYISERGGVVIPTTQQSLGLNKEKDAQKKNGNSANKLFLVAGAIGAIFLVLLLRNLTNLAPKDTPMVPADSSVTVPMDSLDSIVPESLRDSLDTLETTLLPIDTTEVTSASGTTPLVVAEKTPSAPVVAAPAAASVRNTSVIMKALVDTVWIQATRSGKKDIQKVLKRDTELKIWHDDTIFVSSGVQGALEVRVAGKTITPKDRRFKIFGSQIVSY